MFSSNTSQVSSSAANYIEDVFSTWLYTGNGSTQVINSGINLATKGGLVWFKSRNNSTFANSPNCLTDSVTGFSKYLISEQTQFQQNWGADGPVPKSYGFDLPINGSVPYTNYLTGSTYVSWTFRKQPKFFDVVTWTGDGTSGRSLPHSLGSVPGCVIIKRTSNTSDWLVWHRSLSGTYPSSVNYLRLNLTSAQDTASQPFTQAPSSTDLTLSASVAANGNGSTYVAYLFAHNAGGFGLTGTDNVISCGSFTGNASANGPVVNLGFEPQWLLLKNASYSTANWILYDNMRGWPVGSNSNLLYPNTSDAEVNASWANIDILPTGFQVKTSDAWINGNVAGDTMIYIAIRRGPMKTPTTGTSVFNPVARTGTGTNPTVVTTNNNPDLLMSFPRTASPAAYGMCFWDKLRGISPMLQSASTSAETNTNTTRVLQGWLNTGYQAGADFIEGYLNYSGSTYVNYPITRAPGFFDEVCYTGTSTGSRAVTHNLGVAPEMVIVKQRTAVGGNRSWWVLTTSGPRLNILNDASAANAFGVPANLFGDSTYNNYIAPTATTVTLSPSDEVNGSSNSYVMYLFASCPGVSKVGSYTGTGATLQIDCGFTGGARFVLIKRTDSTGSWYVWDSARGIVAGNDPYLLLNSTAAEVTNTDWVDTHSPGFELSNSAGNLVNVNGGTYIFLAIA